MRVCAVYRLNNEILHSISRGLDFNLFLDPTFAISDGELE